MIYMANYFIDTAMVTKKDPEYDEFTQMFYHIAKNSGLNDLIAIDSKSGVYSPSEKLKNNKNLKQIIGSFSLKKNKGYIL